MATPAFKIFAFAKARTSEADGNKSLIGGRYITTLEVVKNDYHVAQLPEIAAGTVIQMDFGGDFGLYGIADVGGVLHKIKINLDQLHLLDWSPYAAEIEAQAA